MKTTIGKKIYLLLSIGIVILALMSFSSNFLIEKNFIQQNALQKIESYNKRFNNYLEEESQVMKSYLEFIKDKKDLQKEFILSNKHTLYENSKEIYEKLNLNNEITHFYFIKSDGEAFLRVHDFARDKDIIDRYTFKQAKKTNKTSHGIEFGPKKNYTLRVVSPWIVEGKLIGYIELGKEVDKVLGSLSKQLNIEVFFAVNKQEYKNSPKFIQDRLKKRRETKDHYIVYNTIPCGEKLADYVDKHQHLQWIEVVDKHYITYLEELRDVSGKNLGKILYLININSEYTHLKDSLVLFLLIISIVSFVILITGFIFTKKQQKDLDTLLYKLENEKQKVETSYNENKNLLSLFDKSDSVLFRWNNDEHWSIDYVSSNVENLLGFTKEEFLQGKIKYDQCIHKDDLEHVFWEVEKGKKSQEEFFKHDPYRVLTKNGSLKWILDYTVLSKDKEGNITHLLGYIIDITDRELSKNKILDQKQEFETIFNYAQDGIAITDIEGNFLNCNNAFIDLIGYTKEEIYTKNCSDLTTEEYQEINQKALEKAIQYGSVENIDKECILKNGDRIFVNMSVSLLPDKKRLLLLLHDNTSLKFMQKQAKLASMGEMIGNIAHQWRQPLGIITTSASGMKLQAELGQNIENKTIVEFSDLIVKQAQYLSETIDNFRNFIKQDSNYTTISIKSTLEQSLSLVEATLKNNYITVVNEIKDECSIHGNTNELCEALINIFNNSKDVLKEKVESYDDRLLFISTNINENNQYEIIIKDSGGGIDKAIIERIFEPYFTTKHQSIGTGLGLSMVDKIIRERHHGKIDLFNEYYTYNNKEYKGLCFKITFNL